MGVTSALSWKMAQLALAYAASKQAFKLMHQHEAALKKNKKPAVVCWVLNGPGASFRQCVWAGIMAQTVGAA